MPSHQILPATLQVNGSAEADVVVRSTDLEEILRKVLSFRQNLNHFQFRVFIQIEFLSHVAVGGAQVFVFAFHRSREGGARFPVDGI